MSRMLIAVTTCPRPGGVSYLEQTLASLAGPATKRCHVAVLDDDAGQGARWNAWRALRLGAAFERLLLLQDDVICEPGCVERALDFEIPHDVGVVNFHDFGDDFFFETPPAGVHRFEAHRFGSMGMCGAQALLIPGEQASWLAAQDRTACPQPGPHGADYAIGFFTARSPRPWKLIVSPSPVRHIGERSACHEEERRLARVGIPHAGQTWETIDPLPTGESLSARRSRDAP